MPVVEVPGMGDVEFPDDMSDDQIAAAIKKNMEPVASAAQPEKPLGPWASAAIRPIAKGVAALPLMAMDLGVGTRNLLTGADYELPSSMFQRSLDEFTTPPSGALNRGAEFVSSTLVGSRMPAPQATRQPPASFAKPVDDLVRQATLAKSQQAGYVVPPSTTNPTTMNQILESVGGKIATAQDAAVRNQAITNTLAKRTLGLSDDAPLTQESLAAIRREAGDAYEVLRGAGKITADTQFTDDLAKVTAKYTGASKDFPELAKSEVTDLVRGVAKKEFSSDSAVDLLSILRDKADRAFSTGDKGLGKAYKAVAKAVEDVVERNLKGQGQTELVKQFKDARQIIAKTYSVENAFNPATGNVAATKLGTQLTKGKPLSGDLLTAARFGQAFPKAAQAITDSGSVRNLDTAVGMGTAALAREPSYLLYPFLRQGVRAGLLSGPGQSMAVPGASQGIPPGLFMGGLTAEEQARIGLLGEQ